MFCLERSDILGTMPQRDTSHAVFASRGPFLLENPKEAGPLSG